MSGRLEFKHVEYFRAVMAAGTVSGAAALLNVSQPNVSRVLKHAESRLGLRLFELNKGRLQPTPEANEIFSDVQSLHQHLEALQDSIRRLAAGERRRFPLGTSPSLGRHVVPIVLARLREQVANLAVKLDVLSMSQVTDYLLYGQGECACTIFPVDHPLLQTLPCQAGRLLCVVPSGHRLAGKVAVRAVDLATEPLIGFELNTPHGREVDAFFAAAEIQPNYGSLVRFAESACALAEQGHGVALVDEFTVAGSSYPDLVRLEIDWRAPFRIYLHYASSRPLSSLGQRYAELLRRYAVSA
jgi:DNA-binding transcriptional LysR family regulator